MKWPAVYLVGAGPGDPGLITARGLECLKAADVVVHDHLIPRALLTRARADAELIDVGTAAPAAMAQEAISYLIAEKAREDKLVVRLKWGDPFVFDRGAEEALFLHEQGVPFEVIPGIPAGIGVPAYAGVPVSFPECGDTITLLRGYEDESRTLPDTDWASLARLGGTIVCYVGAQQLPRILRALVEHGWPADGPAVVTSNGTMPNQTSVSGTIAELLLQYTEVPGNTAHHAGSPSARRTASILVAGRVAALRPRMRWFDARPLFGRRVLVTRPRDQAAELVDRLTALGAEAVEAPMIRIAPPEDPGPLHRAAARPPDFDWIVFASVNAVDAFMAAFLADGSRDLRAMNGPRLCAVGSGTADRLRHHGLHADVVPETFHAEGLVAAMVRHGAIAGTRALLPRADIGRDVIADQLRERGATVTDVVAYRTVLAEDLSEGAPDVYGMLLNGRIDVVTFTSASAVRSFSTMYGAEQAADLLSHTQVAAIGPVTAEAATNLGFRVTIQPSSFTIPALVAAIATHFTSAASSPETAS